MASDGQRAEAWLGFDLGGSKMLATVYDATLAPLGRDRRSTRVSSDSSPDSDLERIVESIDAALDDASLGRSDLLGVGIGCPGPVDMLAGVVREALNLGWREVAVGESLSAALGCPVRVLNDVDAGVYGEYRFGSARGSRSVVGIFPGTGIGGGFVYEGRILSGAAITCLEIGQLPLFPQGVSRGTGRCHMLEQVASRLSIASAAAAAVCRGDAPHLASLAGSDVAKIRSAVLAESVAAGDAVVEAIIREAAEWIGVAAAGVVHLLAPDTIVLGGGMVEAMPELFLDGVTAGCDRNVLDSFRGSYTIATAALADNAAVLGAAAWAQGEIAGEPTLQTG